jgi:hypothetical protein
MNGSGGVSSSPAVSWLRDMVKLLPLLWFG